MRETKDKKAWTAPKLDRVPMRETAGSKGNAASENEQGQAFQRS